MPSLHEIMTTSSGDAEGMTADDILARYTRDVEGFMGPEGEVPPEGPEAGSGEASGDPAPEAAPVDAWGAVPEHDRDSVLAIYEAMNDPARGLRVAEALRDPVVPPPALDIPEPEFTPPAAVTDLPESFIDGTPEAELWKQQQQILAGQQADRDFREAQQRHDVQQRQQQEVWASVQRAGDAFASRYAGRLEPSDLQNLGTQAAELGLLDPLARSTAARNGRAEPSLADYEEATTHALEFALLRDENLRAKVMTPGAAPPEAPVALPPTDADRRKMLASAVSAVGSPAAPSPQSPPLTARPDGRFDGDSRSQLLSWATDKIRRDQGGT
jgi:hypothetical protein